MPVEEISNLKDFKSYILDDNIPSVVLFFKHGCPPCERYLPIFNNINSKYKNVRFVRVPVNLPEAKEILNIFTDFNGYTPCVRFLQGRKIIKDFGIDGYEDGSQLNKNINIFIK